MKKFLKRLTCFVLFALTAFVLTYAGVDYLWNNESAENTIFIWGDSQAYRGINLDEMARLTGKRVLTAARHGAGPYDFLVFCEKVPKSSDVIVALSKPVQLRRKSRDRNWSGISPRALYLLYKRNYSLYDIGRIVLKNLKPARMYLSHVPLYPYYNALVIAEPISIFEKIYRQKPVYLDDKQALYMEGLRELKKKDCKIALIEFPYHPFVQAIENRSSVKKYLDSFREKVLALFERHKVEVIEIDISNAMYDLSHLNRYGATMVARKIAEKLRYANVTTLYAVRGGLSTQVSNKD